MDYPSVIAMDGPVASGKTTVGRALAERLGYRFVDTGVFYRAVTIAALDGALPRDEDSLNELAERLRIELLDGSDRVLIDGSDVTSRLRAHDVDATVSSVAKVPGVRRAMVAQQRATAEGGSVVMVGRDIGTIVLPDAVKVYLDAPLEERARRRHAELTGAGNARSEADVRADLELRDKTDIQREDSPLRSADDAYVIDTGSLDLEEVVERVLTLIAVEQPE